MNIETAMQFVVSLGLGMLIGMERQRTQNQHQGDARSFAGVRTFSLVALLGAISVYASERSGQPWLVGLVFLAVIALEVVAYQVSARNGKPGITTEVSLLITFFVGALSTWGEGSVAGAVAVLTMLMLALKGWLHNLARKIEASDVEATLKFAVITLVILPLVPNTDFGPAGLEVINLHKTWLMVVLIAGLNFVGYILVKVVGREHGLAITGLLGGLVSSTAVTLSFSQRSRTEPYLASLFVLTILLAWTVMFFRILVVVGIVNISLAGHLLPAILLMGLVTLGICLLLWRRGRKDVVAEVESGSNPFELGGAIKFGILFAVVIFLASAAQNYFGAVGLYAAGALAGLTDVDAISLSMAHLAQEDTTNMSSAAQTVIIAIISNTLVKSGMVFWLGAPEMRKTIWPIALILTVSGLISIYLLR